MAEAAQGGAGPATAADHPAEPVEAPDVTALVEALGAGVMATALAPGQVTVLVEAGAWLAAAQVLRDRGYAMLTSLTAVDFPKAPLRFQVVAHFRAVTSAPPRLLRLKAGLAAEAPVIATLTELYPTAEWHERETYDMFGIEFAGHPDLRRILMPESYEGYPLRKDHPLGYEEVAFSHNKDAVHGAKPRAGRQ